MSGLPRALQPGASAVAVAIALMASAISARSPTQTAPFALQSVSVGSSHACGITADHTAYCWGRNAEGELGNASATAVCSDAGVPCSTRPVRVDGNLSFAMISAGHNYTCGVTTGGAAYCWGFGAQGQLGNGAQASSRRPVRVSLETETFQTISAGTSHTCAIARGGAAYCWGSNAGGMLGIGAGVTGGRVTPTPVAGGYLFRTISAGYFHTCGVTRDGRTLCWGRNELGEVGIGTTTATGRPARVAGQFTGRFVEAAGQFDYTCAMSGDGTLYCWGANCFAQLGVDSTAEQCGTPAMPCSSKPAPVRGGGAYQAVSTYYSHSCAVTSSGVLECWGDNNQGQLGKGNEGDMSATPVSVPGDSTYRAVGVGRQFTCALNAAGVVQCFGRNAEGQIGDGTTTNRPTPTPVIAP